MPQLKVLLTDVTQKLKSNSKFPVLATELQSESSRMWSALARNFRIKPEESFSSERAAEITL
jgi:hypothetical protein